MDKLPLNDIPMLVSAINFCFEITNSKHLTRFVITSMLTEKNWKPKWQHKASNGRKNKRNFGKNYDYNIQVSHVQKL